MTENEFTTAIKEAETNLSDQIKLFTKTQKKGHLLNAIGYNTKLINLNTIGKDLGLIDYKKANDKIENGIELNEKLYNQYTELNK